MDKKEMSEIVLAAKKAKGKTWKQLSDKLDMGAVYLASCCLGESSMDEASAKSLGQMLDLSSTVVETLQEYATKGWTLGEKLVPTDPLIYRFYEIMAVYGASVKDVTQEMFGDGIMSAIDFKIDVTRLEDPKGDRVVITMDGKFLPYKKW